MTKEEEINYYDEILKKIESIFTDINFDTSLIAHKPPSVNWAVG